MTEAVKQMVTYAFFSFPLSKLYAPVYEYNHASMRVLEKAGFEKEGILKKAATKNGREIDLHYYGFVKKTS